MFSCISVCGMNLRGDPESFFSGLEVVGCSFILFCLCRATHAHPCFRTMSCSNSCKEVPAQYCFERPKTNSFRSWRREKSESTPCVCPFLLANQQCSLPHTGSSFLLLEGHDWVCPLSTQCAGLCHLGTRDCGGTGQNPLDLNPEVKGCFVYVYGTHSEHQMPNWLASL